eukprot:scaffold473_cov189-Alexandrium_tamarense.AAC.9
MDTAVSIHHGEEGNSLFHTSIASATDGMLFMVTTTDNTTTSSTKHQPINMFVRVIVYVKHPSTASQKH